MYESLYACMKFCRSAAGKKRQGELWILNMYTCIHCNTVSLKSLFHLKYKVKC